MSDKSNAVTDDEFVEADELLASIPVEAEAMDLAEADGFMTAVLKHRRPKTGCRIFCRLLERKMPAPEVRRATNDSEHCFSNVSIRSEIS